QIGRVMAQLTAEAEDVIAVCGPPAGEEAVAWRARRVARLKAREQRDLITQDRRNILAAAVLASPAPGCEELRDFYENEVRPFLTGNGHGVATLADANRTASAFQQRRLALPRDLQQPLNELERICNEY